MLGEFPVVANIPVTDLERARAFYSDILGLELVGEVEGEGLHYRCGGGSRLEVYRTRVGVGAGHTEAGFQVDDIELLVTELQQQGVVFEDYDLGEGLMTVSGVVSWGEEKAAWFTDPEGNVIGLFQAKSGD